MPNTTSLDLESPLKFPSGQMVKENTIAGLQKVPWLRTGTRSEVAQLSASASALQLCPGLDGGVHATAHFLHAHCYPENLYFSSTLSLHWRAKVQFVQWCICYSQPIRKWASFSNLCFNWGSRDQMIWTRRIEKLINYFLRVELHNGDWFNASCSQRMKSWGHLWVFIKIVFAQRKEFRWFSSANICFSLLYLLA